MSLIMHISSNAHERVNLFSLSFPDYSLQDAVYTAIKEENDEDDDITEEEKKQVEKSRQDIAAGRFKRYKNVKEYLKSLDDS